MIRSIVLLLAIWGVARFCHHQTKGFRLSKIADNTTCLEQASSPLPIKLHDVLQQKFTYLGRGLQSFSFVSEDQTTVLKLFNNRYQRKLFWLKYFPFRDKKTYFEKKWKMAFESYQIACNDLKEETGLFYFHPAKSIDSPTVTIVDPLHIAHKIDLNEIAFALQKKTTLAYSYISECAEKKEYERAKGAFSSLFTLLKKKMQIGIADRDPLIRTNFGFCNDKAVQIDIGPFSYDPSLKDPEKQKETIEKIVLPLKHFLETHHPDLLPYFDEALKNS